jgi:hypothetical protein
MVALVADCCGQAVVSSVGVQELESTPAGLGNAMVRHEAVNVLELLLWKPALFKYIPESEYMRISNTCVYLL